jgi:hypothetical protein
MVIKDKRKTIIYKTLHRKQNIGQHEPTPNGGWTAVYGKNIIFEINTWPPSFALLTLASMIYFDSDMSKSTNTVVYFDWKTVIHIYACGKCRTQLM